jgi:hypothetical protein
MFPPFSNRVRVKSGLDGAGTRYTTFMGVKGCAVAKGYGKLCEISSLCLVCQIDWV